MVSAKTLPKDEIATIESLLKAFDPLFVMSNTVSAKCIHAFLLVAANEGRSVSEYAQLIKMPQSTLSRVLLDLGDSNRYNGEGFDLIFSRDNPEDRREKEYHLTDKGRTLVHRISRIVGNHR